MLGIKSISCFLTYFRQLLLNGNPISSLKNNSFEVVNRELTSLDISHLPLDSIDGDALEVFPYLSALRITAWEVPSSEIPFNLPRLLQSEQNLRELWIEAPRSFDDVNIMTDSTVQLMPEVQSTDLSRAMDGLLPFKLHLITLSGNRFHSLDSQILKVR